ncbi:hypothetical protein PIIN_05459 [Serendipita indica DSM 11827]|uniref:Uncharacterized protein n=1 Tax=Serendipita indica (strain DSM 11827) TaxID=1109443 RepID=G4TJM9_SERID|nr:hypothetical protein PIIN_05459 [Serendipita indica DSM 11827]
MYATSSKKKGRPLPNEERVLTIQKLSERAIVLTPWRGHPTFLHILAFVQELERRFGRIWWAGINNDTANPYELQPSVVVVFESSTSLRKIPGFIYDLANTPEGGHQPAANETNEESSKSAAAKEFNNMTPLFVPWSKKLDESALQQGGPALEDVLAFLGTGPPATASAPGEGDTTPKASWDEFDEAVNIDAVLKKWHTKQFYLPKVVDASRPSLYLRPKQRLAIANAIVDFGGFSAEPVPAMKKLVAEWKEEADIARTSGWTPYVDPSTQESEIEEPIGEVDALFGKEESEGDFEWDDAVQPHLYQTIDESVQAEFERMKAEEHAYQPIGYSSLAVDKDLNAPHPLQFPQSVREADSTAQIAKATTRPSSDTKDQETPSQPPRKQRRRDDWDDWRNEPRPFRDGLGRDDPALASPLSMRLTAGARNGTSGVNGEPTPTMPGSHSINSASWETDRRGKKLRNRSEAEMNELARHGLVGTLAESDRRPPPRKSRQGPEKRWEEIFPKEDERARLEIGEEERKVLETQEAKERQLKERLRAILDGT